jgi:hypothetical protein
LRSYARESVACGIGIERWKLMNPVQNTEVHVDSEYLYQNISWKTGIGNGTLRYGGDVFGSHVDIGLSLLGLSKSFWWQRKLAGDWCRWLVDCPKWCSRQPIAA